jgi:tetratricopeptide (TPR) repeat protein
MMAVVLAVLFVAGCTSPPEEKAAKHIENVSAMKQEMKQEKTVEYWRQKSFDYIGKNDSYELAELCIDKAIELDPLDEHTWIQKGDILRWQGNDDEAIQAYDNAIKVNPSNGYTWESKGWALYLQGKYDSAIECYDSAIKVDPLNYLFWARKGQALCEQGKHDEADQAFDNARKVDTEYGHIYNCTEYLAID